MKDKNQYSFALNKFGKSEKVKDFINNLYNLSARKESFFAGEQITI